MIDALIRVFAREPGREFVALTHARTDPPNQVTAVFLAYTQAEAWSAEATP